ncbi:MAG: phosphatidylglycerophosphatase A [Paenibacillaceae bacterium]
MKSFLADKEQTFAEMLKELYTFYPKQDILLAVIQLLRSVKTIPVELSEVEAALNAVLKKTETFSVLLTLMELEKRTEIDPVLQESMKHPSYNQHRTIALNICHMYSSGAVSFFGYVDCTFRSFFPQKHPKSFIAKGVCALIASTAEVLVTGIVEDYTEENLAMLLRRGVTLNHIADMVLTLQKPYNVGLTLEDCKVHVLGVLRKQQTFHTIQLCVQIDEGVEQDEFEAQFQAIVANDEGLYGVDEAVNISISMMYGMIAITNFGYLDKTKPGIIGELDKDHSNGKCNTFLDDTVCALVSASCARLAHNQINTQSKPIYD